MVPAPLRDPVILSSTNYPVHKQPPPIAIHEPLSHNDHFKKESKTIMELEDEWKHAEYNRKSNKLQENHTISANVSGGASCLTILAGIVIGILYHTSDIGALKRSSLST